MKERSKTFHERILCRECNAALEDIEYCLIQSRCFPRPGKHPLEELAPIQRGRASWYPAHINYLVTKDTYEMYLEKFNALVKTREEK